LPSKDQIKDDEMGGTYTEEERNVFNIHVGKFEEIALGKPRHRKEENVKMALKETGCEIVQ
jgi:hypothetical protein